MNQVQKYFFLGLLLLIISCNQVEPLTVAKPKVLLTHEQMAGVLADLHLAEAEVSLTNQTNDSLKQVSIDLYATVYKKHQVTEQDFKNSFNYYKLQPVEIDSIYSDVIERLNTLEADYNASSIIHGSFNKDSIRLH